ncbi:MAG: 7-carboxy-7-deazaguanine synthase QueE [Deltaproteobacteria bacterium]|nr:7-carboxy-7-deazaguanine synthase QueE [Deltaproteobacteria bacterium]MBW2395319.1 7-carboxy-7-deazaguanine synthase QueE [Deltaproteobacteria bacterium]
MSAANLVEVFSSIQGEGPEVGTRTLFVRFGECDLRCRWCDSPGTWKRADRMRFETAPGSERWEEEPNLVTPARLLAIAKRLDLASHRWVSLTGGEPLLQPEAVASAAEILSGYGPGIFLETHGLHTEALAQVIDRIDFVSMDWKLASDVRRESDAKGAEAEPFHEAHQRFLETARAAPGVSVKLVITPASEDAEIDAAVQRVAEAHPGACLVLQPVTPHGPVQARPTAARMQALAMRAGSRIRDVRVIPQTHPLLGVA